MKLALLVFGILTFSISGKSQDLSASDINRANKLFSENCATCHGVNGDGKSPIARAMKPPPRNFLAEDFKYGSTEDKIFATISKGVEGTGMPPWVQLPEDDRHLLAKYVLFLRSPKK